MELTMANPKAEPKPNKVGRPEVDPSDLRMAITSFRGKSPFKGWFERLRKHTRFSGATLIEMALVEYAERHGFEEKAPER